MFGALSLVRNCQTVKRAQLLLNCDQKAVYWLTNVTVLSANSVLTRSMTEYKLDGDPEVIIILILNIYTQTRYLATTSADQTAKLWRTSDFTLHSTLQTENQRWVWDIAFSADSQYAITGEGLQVL